MNRNKLTHILFYASLASSILGTLGVVLEVREETAKALLLFGLPALFILCRGLWLTRHEIRGNQE